MKVLFIGDIVGKSGRIAVKENLPVLIKQYQIDFVIANGENSAHGKGITGKIYNELLSMGIHAITMGNHTYSKHCVENILNEPHLIIPKNYQLFECGSGVRYYSVNGQKIGVVNLLGRAFMERDLIDPFISMKEILEEEPDALYFVDFHGEATGEKATFARYFSKDIVACLGTHTHVQTADERLIDGCAFISDVGMCGAYESILGRDIDNLIQARLTNEKTKYQVAEGPGVFMGVVVTIENNRATDIERIQIRPEI